MAKNEIQVTVKGKPGSGKSTIIKLISIALAAKGIHYVIDEAEGEDVAQHHLDNGAYSQTVQGLRATETKVRLRAKTPAKKPKPEKGGPGYDIGR